MRFIVHADGQLDLGGRLVPCALGETGVTLSARKREGDGATPVGRWPLRRVLFRPDRGDAPRTRLPIRALAPTDGWCDDPADPAYNRQVTLPYPSRAESLWRDDGLYDLVVVLGHNDAPPVSGAGSAIFLHVARPDFSPTRGCVAISSPDLVDLLARARLGDVLEIRAGPEDPPPRTRRS